MEAMPSPAPRAPAPDSPDQVELEAEVIDFFVALASLLGQPRSVAEIYGLLFISREPLSMVDLIERLALSKGSASQGLRLLRELGAVQLIKTEGDRRDYYRAETSLKKIVSGYLDRELEEHITGGRRRIDSLQRLRQTLPDEDGFYRERIARLEQWYRRGSRAVPLLKTFLSL